MRETYAPRLYNKYAANKTTSPNIKRIAFDPAMFKMDNPITIKTKIIIAKSIAFPTLSNIIFLN